MLEIEVTRKYTYSVQANGREVSEMRKVSQWEGLSKLEDANGRVLIVADLDGPHVNAMREVFSDLGIEGNARRHVVVKGSPDLISALTAEPCVSETDRNALLALVAERGVSDKLAAELKWISEAVHSLPETLREVARAALAELASFRKGIRK